MNRTEKREAGLCYDCHAPAEPGRTRCSKHLASNTRRNEKEGYKEQHRVAEGERRKTLPKGFHRQWDSFSPSYHQKLRREAIDHLGGPRCTDCGCDRLEILEINHIFGGGKKDTKGVNRTNFYRRIIEDPDARIKYNVMCKPCNALHYVREILGIKGHTIMWGSELVMQDSEFIEERAKEIFEKFKGFIPEEHQSAVLQELILGMLKVHIDVVQNDPTEDEDD